MVFWIIENYLDHFGDSYYLAGDPYTYIFDENDYCLMGLLILVIKKKFIIF